ncbi:divergent polysaccharide deacetylase family protein [Roseobacter sinensis]|uniref:Divergent polysaccharide deacetylase family protein n=1 Tax=Roseobacter sinensis TaxID=2931391 RepID=A0ABT3BFQ0_9RHOB|nr:divergent polysaccharide deacetylase family protein [Roseobacter sp. WL0113]MCV3272387.1 divergent polysaccharide deacetylase family protein [Roseobacter sp. WL0113]
MARGFLRGALWGSAVGLGAVAVLSAVTEPPRPPDVEAAAPVTETAPEPAVTDAAQPREDRVPVTGQEGPKAPAPQPDTLAAVGDETLRPAAQPQTGEAPGLTDPGPAADTSGVTRGETETRETPRPQALGLTAPKVEPGVAVSTEPATPPGQPPQPAPDGEQLALTEDPQQPTAPLPDAESIGLAEPAPPAAAVEAPDGSISQDPEQPPLPDVPAETQAFAPEPAVEPDPQPAPDTPAAADTPAPAEDAVTPQIAAGGPGTATSPSTPRAQERGSAQPPAQTLPEETTAVPELASEDVLAGVGAPVGRVGNLAPDVQINRLPNLRDETPAALGPQTAPDPEEAETAPPVLARPIERFAVPVENPEGKPMMAIVLMDGGVDLSAGTIGLPALRSFPYPISFAVDSSLPDAAERMAAYRAEGFEVLAIVDLPQGAQAQDAETSLSVALDAVPEAVGVLEGVGEGLQGSREAAMQVAEILAQTGHGFVTQNNGLNTVQKLAARSGVPSAVVFRDFDDADQSPTVIRRFLDQAAFRAGRVGTVVMLGRLREDTISALLIWGLQDRAAQVALVPISAALTTEP